MPLPEKHQRARIRLPSSLCKPSLRVYFDWEDSWNDDYAKRPALLDLFAGGGGAAMGYYLAGFRVVGVDIRNQPHYPFEFHQADALTYPLDGFDAYHASPPCQYYTRLRHLPWLKFRQYWRSVPPTLTYLKSVWHKPCVIENVEDCFDLPASFVLCGSSIGLELYRHRRFLTTFFVMQYPHQKHKRVIASGSASLSKRHHGDEGFREINRDSQAKHFGGVERARRNMGIDWMTRDELSQAIPPVYTEYIGKYLMQAVKAQDE